MIRHTKLPFSHPNVTHVCSVSWSNRGSRRMRSNQSKNILCNRMNGGATKGAQQMRAAFQKTADAFGGGGEGGKIKQHIKYAVEQGLTTPARAGVAVLLNLEIGTFCSIALYGLSPRRSCKRRRRNSKMTTRLDPTAPTKANVWPVSQQGRKRVPANQGSRPPYGPSFSAEGSALSGTAKPSGTLQPTRFSVDHHT